MSDSELSNKSFRANQKSLGDAVGLPDELDKEFIRKLITKYDKKYPGFIKAARDEARAQHAAAGGDTAKFSEVNSDARGRLLFELPEELHHNIEQSYPLMFSNKKHFRWFCKNFKELMIPDKY